MSHGFIEQIVINQWAFIRCARDLFANHPVRDVFLTLQNPTWPDMRIPLRGQHRFGWLRFGSATDLRIGSMPGVAVVAPIRDGQADPFATR